jgi:hypothetical protein
VQLHEEFTIDSFGQVRSKAKVFVQPLRHTLNEGGFVRNGRYRGDLLSTSKNRILAMDLLDGKAAKQISRSSIAGRAAVKGFAAFRATVMVETGQVVPAVLASSEAPFLNGHVVPGQNPENREDQKPH